VRVGLGAVSELTPPRCMNEEVAQHVRNRASNFRREAQYVRVIAVREHLTRAMHQAVKPPRDTHRESLQATGEPHLVWRLDDEVKMVPLHREMHKAEDAPIAAALERFAQ